MTANLDWMFFVTPDCAIAGDYLLVKRGRWKIATPMLVVRTTYKLLWLHGRKTPLRRDDEKIIHASNEFCHTILAKGLRSTND
jgi:hypothetical protein